MVRIKGRAYRARGAVTARLVLAYLAVGVLVGVVAGYIFMGTAHALLETSGATHYAASGAAAAGSATRGGAAKAAAAGGQRAAEQQQGAGGQEQRSMQEERTAGDAQLQQGGGQQQGAQLGASGCSTCIHTLATSNGSPYQNYQMRIAHATYQLIRAMRGGDKHVAFTRILHRTKDDPLMGEIPTFRADPLQPKCDGWCEYPVSDRANAVQQFWDAAKRDPSMIKAPWIYMIESDYVFMKPLAAPQVEDTSVGAWAFPFDYIQPLAHAASMKRLYSGPASDIPNTGPAPFLARVSDWLRITPSWEKKAAEIEADKELKKELGWVREMYGFSIAVAEAGLKVEMLPPQQSPFIVQLPGDDSLGRAHAFHYTQCTIYQTVEGSKDVWKYDKRFHTSLEDSLRVPLIEEPPAVFKEGAWKFIEGAPVTRAKHQAITMMIRQMNRGIKTLQPLGAVPE